MFQKQAFLIAFILAVFPFTIQAVEKLKPFILADIQQGNFTSVVEETKAKLNNNGFSTIAEYAPYPGSTVILATNKFLKRLAVREANAAYIASMRVSVTNTDTGIQVAYLNPDYYRYAYRIETDLKPLSESLEHAIGRMKTFGSKGLSPKKLKKYHYTFGMEYFDEQLHLASYDSHDEAVASVRKRLNENKGGTVLAYELPISGTETTVFGVGMTDDPSADKHVMDIIDHKPTKQTAHLPNEIVVIGERVYALHPRFRIAVNFPDTRMVGKHGFTNILDVPDATIKALTLGAGGELDQKSVHSMFDGGN